MARILIQDIAREGGVHASTVSRALRDDPRIRPEVRARLREIAIRLGYVPDPHLRALAKYRTRAGSAEYRGLLGWLTNYPRRGGWKHAEKIAYHVGAKRRARELGYELEEFWLREPGIDPKRLHGILRARGIRGVLLPPQQYAATRIELSLEGLAAISFGHTLAAPRLHVVHHHHYRSMLLLLQELAALGYRRPGLVLTVEVDQNVEGAWSAAYRYFMGKSRPDPLITDNLKAEELLGWWKKNRPDVVVSEEEQILQLLKKGGIRVPEDCGFALTARHDGHSPCAGIDENSEIVGAVAVDQLASLVERGEFGVPDHPLDVLVEGTWRTLGKTVRDLGRKA